ncbi:polyketide synthase [Streptomyces sp. ME19-01-6]|uniref:polyketide synthase n=1 Tax=Streptomyces sp. ME19-01-6 TaxID=3028686 RepID=UPI0029BC5E81|nr:polyketide synthase [Streptomyces sp. ME19-01-6]MDX3224950.1 beta-ketoacyl synthase N-terminal-like domain-containing protein [Streptomyces sp. ME19-01-6]
MLADAIDNRLARNPIAIVGLAGLFPRAMNVREFWSNIVDGTDCTEEVPATRFSVADYFDPDPFAEDKTYCRRGGFLPPFRFDPREFGIPPNTLDATGLIQLLSLHVAQDVLRDAGCDTSGWYDPARTGVVLGVCGGSSSMMPLAARLQTPALKAAVLSCGLSERDAEEIARRYTAAFPPWTENSFPGFLGNVVSGRIANRLNLGAFNGTVDAACASSLAALRMAVSELAGHRADLMITGGCDADNTIFSFMCFSKTPALSPSGEIRPFDEDADGTLVGEGIGMLALKRLADAERDGDRVYAVIRGLGTSSDGRSQSIFAPCGDGQLTALRRAYQDADCPPSSVGLIEAHGTGTRTGDEVELGALNALMATPDDRRYAAVGSVKSQIGHTKAAAGAAGLIKAALALHHKVLPATINVRTPSAAARQEDAALYVNTTTRPWIRDPRRPVRRAGVSAFGFGGVNVHAVLEEHQPPSDATGATRTLHTTPRAHLWHAPTPEALRELLERGERPGPVDEIPADHARLGFVATDDSCPDLLAKAMAQFDAHPGRASWTHADGIWYRAAALPAGGKAAALFAGQGSQYVNMGREALLSVPPVRAAFDAANAPYLEGNPPHDLLSDVVYPAPGRDGKDLRRASERLRRTAYAQPAIGALSMGQFRYLTELGFAPDGVLGHSFGELTALWAADCLDDAGFLAATAARARTMAPPADGAGHDPGAMASVRTSPALLDSLLAEFPEVTVCNRNAPEVVVIGGPTAAVERFIATCGERRIPAQRLSVEAAFHTPHVRHAVASFAHDLADIPLRAPRVPVYANTPGANYGDAPEANREVLARQIVNTVDFQARLREMYADGFRVFVEFGPKRTLSQFVEQTLGEHGVDIVWTDIGTGGDSALALKQAAVQLTVLGLPLTGIDRYDEPVPPSPVASAVARVLDGPQFATIARQEAYQRVLGTPYRLAEPVGQEPEPVAGRQSAAPAHDDPLGRAAAEHLTMHTRYLDGQLRTADQLVSLLNEGVGNGSAEAVLAGITAVRDHSLALGEAHARASEVLSDLLRLPAGGTPTGYAPNGTSDGPLNGVNGTASGVAAAALAAADGQALETPSHTGRFPSVDGAPESPVPLEPDGPVAPGEAAAPSGKSALEMLRDTDFDVAIDPELRAELANLDPLEIEQVMREVVAEKTGYSIDMIDPDIDLQTELGIDSLKQLEIASELWRRYPVFSREEIFRFTAARTVRDFATLIPEVLKNPTTNLRVATSVPLGRAHIGWRRLPEPDVLLGAYGEPPRAVLVDDGGELADWIATALQSHGWWVGRLTLPGTRTASGAAEPDTWHLADWGEESLAEQVSLLGAAVPRLNLCLLPFSRDPRTDRDGAVLRLAHAVLVAKHLRTPLGGAVAGGTRAGFVAVTRLDGALGYAGSGGEPERALAGGVTGLVKSLALEAPELFCRTVDLAPELTEEEVGACLAGEIADAAVDVHEVARHPAGRRTPVLVGEPVRLVDPAAPDGQGGAVEPPAELTADDVLLVTGGARGITAWCAIALARQVPCGFLLLGSTPSADEPDWAAGLDGKEELTAAAAAHLSATGHDPEEPAAVELIARQVREITSGREIRTTLAALHNAGAEAAYVAVDLTDAAAVGAALRPHADRVTGVIHGAGVLADQFLADKEADGVGRVVGTKLTGLGNVLAALDAEHLRRLVVFTSVSGIYGNLRQADYALANEALSRFACAWKARHPGRHVTALAWGPWAGGMATPGVQKLFMQHGVPLLARDAGTGYFTEQMSPDRAADLVTVIGPLEPMYRRSETLPADGVVMERRMAELAAEPLLADHRIHGWPVLPLTAAVGWGVRVVEAMHGGQPVVECRDFQISKGLVFDGSAEDDRFLLTVSPPERPENGDTAAITVRLHSEREGAAQVLRFAGGFVPEKRAAQPPDIDLSACELPGLPELPDFDPQTHEAYDGFLFHGPTLRGLGPTLEERPGRLVLAARMADPVFGQGAFAGARYSPALADLLLQAAALLGRQRLGLLCLPVSVERVELFAPLPADAPFVLVAESVEESPLHLICTVTACTPEGKVLQRWGRIGMILTSPEMRDSGIFLPAERGGRHG